MKRIFPIDFCAIILLCITYFSLNGCIAIPIISDNFVSIQVAPPIASNDLEIGKKIMDNFSCQFGYVTPRDTVQETQAGEILIKTFGYSGSLKKVRIYELPDSVAGEEKNLLPQYIRLQKGENGQLFFGVLLQHGRDENSPAVRQFITAIQKCYGKERARVARPTTIDWLGIGD